MSDFAPAETLRQNRPLLMACEAIGWLHMIGKAKAAFVRYHGGQPSGYRYEQWFAYERPPFPWADLLQWAKGRFILHPDAWPETLTDFVTKHTKRDHGLLGLLQAAHGMVSGIEKNLPRSTSTYLDQDVTHLWITTVFGHPVRNLLADRPAVLTDEGWRRLVEEIQRILEDLRRLGESGCQDARHWWHWREGAVGPGSLLRQACMSTLAETRLPNNDVTLWDQSYVTAALFKSAVAGAVLEGDTFRWDDGGLKHNTRWRLLTVGMGTDHYEARAVKIGDWTGARAAIEAVFECVCKLIEVDLAVGSLLYRDSMVCVFSFPGEPFDESTPADWLNGWELWLQSQVDAFAQQLNLETPPYVCLSPPTRSLVPIVRQRDEASNKLAIPVHRRWNIRGDLSRARGHICPVCLVRLSKDTFNKGQPCDICKDRRYHRLGDWLAGRLGSDTIWLEEVADAEDRIALVTFQLDIEPWLEGKRADSLRAQAISAWFTNNKGTKVGRSIENQTRAYAHLHAQERLIRYFEKRIKQPTGDLATDGVLRGIIPGFEEEFDNMIDASQSWKDLFSRFVEDRALIPKWGQDPSENARWFVFQAFRKLVSPGRIYRLWRQTENFFYELLDEFRQIASRDPNRWRVRRLWLVPDDETCCGWEEGQLYDGRWNGQHVSLVYHRDGFLTACNLARVMHPEDTVSVWESDDSDIELWDPDSSPLTTQCRPLKVKKSREVPQELGHLGAYHPVIPLEVSPLRFRVLVPLEVASACVDLACARWEETFARVLDRLPLRVGVVAFPRKAPFQGVLEMGRILEAELGGEKPEKEAKPETWHVHGCRVQDGVVAISFQRPDGEQELWTVPIRLPDGRKDVFYPYVAVEDRDVRFPLDFQHPEGQVYRHVEDLRPGDGLYVYPARIAVVFLDTTARRFEKPKVHYLDDWKQMRQVWRRLAEQSPSVTQLQQVRQELVRLQEAWGIKENREALDTWVVLARVILKEGLQVQGAVLEDLVEAARKGVLLWAIDWHLSVLKEKPTAGGKP